ncbi:MAG: hypothetical protein OEU26_37015 [Candidatus Tectomicrobia bacterium]|nr:hypothetical protein [Candidatus Tectomicrobia bacterium]
MSVRGEATQEALRDQVWRRDGEAGLAPFCYVLEQWAAAGLLRHTLVSGGKPLVTWVPLASGVAFGRPGLHRPPCLASGRYPGGGALGAAPGQ